MFRKVSVLAIVFASFVAITGPAATALPWPPTSSGTDIGGGLPSGYEPSGIVWDNFTGALWLVHDEGQLSRMLRDGTFTATWDIYLPGTNPPQKPDLESIAVTGTSPKVYLGVEDPPTILEYNSSSTAAPWASGKSWELDLPTVAGSGMEGLTWVPNGYHPYANKIRTMA